MRKIFEILKTLIQNSKKLYLTHLLVLFMLPSLIFTAIAILFGIPHDLFVAYKYDIWGYFEAFYNILAIAGFYCWWCFWGFFMISCLLTAVLCILKYCFSKTPWVTSKFLLYNRFYNFIYIASFMLLILFELIVFF